jgi:hypothetical protein
MRPAYDVVTGFARAFCAAILVVTVAGSNASAAELEKRPINADITSYCPGETKLVILVDIDAFKKTEAVRSLVDSDSLFDFAMRRLLKNDQEALRQWKESPERPKIEEFAKSTSKLMIIDVGGSLDAAAVFEGKYDTNDLRNLVEDNARTHGEKLQISFQPEYTRYDIHGLSIVYFGKTAVAIGFGKSIEMLCEHAKKLFKGESTSRSVHSMRRLARRSGAPIAWAIEDADRRFFDLSGKPYIKTFDLARGSVEVQDQQFKIERTVGFDNIDRAIKGEEEQKQYVSDVAVKFGDRLIAEQVRRATVDRDDKTVTTTAMISTEALRESLDDLNNLAGLIYVRSDGESSENTK